MNDQTNSPAPSANTDGKRDALRAKIDAAERRNAERTLADNARAAATAAVDYTRAHPLTVIGGAAALGLTIGLMTRPGRDAARKVMGSATGAVSGAASSASSGVKSVAARGGTAFGTLFGEAALAYLVTLIDDAAETARAGQERVGEIGDAAGTKARKLRRDAGDAADTAADSTKALARKTRDAATGLVRDLKRKTKR